MPSAARVCALAARHAMRTRGALHQAHHRLILSLMAAGVTNPGSSVIAWQRPMPQQKSACFVIREGSGINGASNESGLADAHTQRRTGPTGGRAQRHDGTEQGRAGQQAEGR